MDYFNYERELLVSLMTGGATPDAIEVMGKIRDEMLTGVFRQMYKSVLFLYSKGSLFGPLEVAEQCNMDYLDLITMCKNSAGSASNIKAYAKRVRQGYLLSKAESSLQEILTDIKECDHESKIGAIAERLEEAVKGMVIETDDKMPRSASDILEQYIEIVDQRCRGAEEQRRLKVGIASIDKITQGFNLIDLIIMAGAPGMGKTELMTSIINGSSSSSGGPLVFSMEMDEYQIIERSIAIESGLPISCARSPIGMQDHEWAKFSEAMGRVKEKKFYVLDQADLSVSDICSKAREHKTRHPETNLICIDYVGLIKLQKAERHDIALGEVSRRLKSLAKELKTPVLLLAQITTKNVEARTNKRPLPSDIKDSSRLQDDADWIIFPYRDEQYHEDSTMKGVAEIIFAKARHGSKGTAYMGWVNGHFTEIDEREAAQMAHQNEVQSQDKKKSSKQF